MLTDLTSKRRGKLNWRWTGFFAAGLVMHQMGGFDRDRLKQELLPEGFEPGTMIAIGHPGDPEELPENLREREHQPRKRKLLSEVVFGPDWGEPASFV